MTVAVGFVVVAVVASAVGLEAKESSSAENETSRSPTKKALP